MTTPYAELYDLEARTARVLDMSDPNGGGDFVEVVAVLSSGSTLRLSMSHSTLASVAHDAVDIALSRYQKHLRGRAE